MYRSRNYYSLYRNLGYRFFRDYLADLRDRLPPQAVVRTTTADDTFIGRRQDCGTIGPLGFVRGNVRVALVVPHLSIQVDDR